MKLNVSIQETKIIAWRLCTFVYRCVTQYMVFTRVKYATTPHNCGKRYPTRSSNGWAEFWPEPMKFLVDKLHVYHAY